MSAERFLPRVIARQAIVGLGAFGSLGLLAPRLLGMEHDLAVSVLSRVGVLAALALVAIASASAFRIASHRFLLRALALGSHAIEPEDLGAFGELPGVVTWLFFALGSGAMALFLAPGVRPETLDDGRAVSLVILGFTVLGTAALPHYVVLRAATMRVIELAPREPVTTLLETFELRREPERRVHEKLLLATVVPVALIGAADVLITHAHLRTALEESRATTAVQVARAALEPAPGALAEAGRDDAIAAAAEVGFIAHIEHGGHAAEPSSYREADGQITVRAPVDDGAALVRFTAELDQVTVSIGVAIALLAVAIAGAGGLLLGRALARDLTLATRGVRLLGTEAVLRGSTRVARPARFEVVEKLRVAIEGLAERFRVFAAAQERALDAREAAQRVRGLLFASVSHDLKSPLNAILGFAELLEQEDLTPAQRESLALVSTRGRELLALIETILDAARVEAGQLKLIPQPAPIPGILADAVRKARDLGSFDAAVEIAVTDDLPEPRVDRAYVTRAVAVVVAHALRAAGSDPRARPVRVHATLDAGSSPRVRIAIEHASAAVSSAELAALFARQASSRGRGLTLGLSLARSIFELHGGGVDVDGAPDRPPIAIAWLPLEPPGRPRLTSRPALA